MSNLDEVTRAEKALKAEVASSQPCPWYRCKRTWLMAAFIVAGIIQWIAGDAVPEWIPEALVWVVAGALGFSLPQPAFLASLFGELPPRDSSTRGMGRVGLLLVVALLAGALLTATHCRPMTHAEGKYTKGAVGLTCAMLKHILDPQITGVSERAAALVARGCDVGTMVAAHIISGFVEPEFGTTSEEVAQLTVVNPQIGCEDIMAGCSREDLREDLSSVCEHMVQRCEVRRGVIIDLE